MRLRRGRDRSRIAIPRRGGSDLDPRVAAMGEDPHRAIRHGRGQGNRPPHGGRGRRSDRFCAPQKIKASTPVRARGETDGDRGRARRRRRGRLPTHSPTLLPHNKPVLPGGKFALAA